MTTAIEKLAKILDLEKEKCQDRAVYGGLSRYADTWLKEAQSAFGAEAEEWIEEIASQLRAYSDLPKGRARPKAVAALSRKLQNPPSPRSSRPQQTQKEKREATTGTDLDSPVTVLHGVGRRQSQRLARLNVHTVRDLINFFPHRYDDYSQLKTINRLEYEEKVSIIGQVQSARVHKTRGGSTLFKAVISDKSGSIEATWFNQPYLANKIKCGQQIVISGEVDEYLGRLCFTAPTWEPLKQELLHTARLVPIHPLTKGLSARWLRKLIKRTVDQWTEYLPDHLPASVRQEEGLMDLKTALSQIHFPDDKKLLKQARYRLAFDELFLLQIGLLRQRRVWRSELGHPIPMDEATLDNFIHSLPFELTDAQKRALRQIVADLRSNKPMNRLLQGDVGSGKTVVAAAAMALTVAGGAQATMMAPTEILAEQHHQTIGRLLAQMPGSQPTVRCLTGSITGQEREEIYTGLANGNVDIVVGTHALIQENVQFKKLALAVIDEQHRFGVKQRERLQQKGYNPHLLVMTATPIPRSLELTLWGHLDASIIDEMPPGRKPVVTRLILPTERERAYSFVRSQIEKGRQAFIICPLVEESDKIEAKAAVEEHQRLQEQIFPNLQLGLLHGRMKGEEKEATMARFAQGELDILIATSVVEVGIDVPNATVMLVEGADRFGLAQLHQFRGRVGRSEHDSYCLLVSGSSSSKAQERLEAVESSNDGFLLAQKDLEMRGPGEFLGARQSGFLDLKLSSVTDLQLVEVARKAARRFFKTDPELTNPDNQPLAQLVQASYEPANTN